MWPKINKDLLPLKGHFFLNMGGVAPVQPFMQVYAKYLGFSSVVVGTIYFILPVMGMLAKPLFGGIADRFRLHKFIFILFQIITIVAFFLIQFIPPLSVENKEVNLVCGTQMNFHIDTRDLEKCLVERIVSASDNIGNTSCRMECILTPELKNEICYVWKRNIPVCSNRIMNNSIPNNFMTVSSPTNSKQIITTDVGKNSHLENLEESDPQIVIFNASVPLKHTVSVYDKLYFRVSTVFLENDVSPLIPFCIQETDTKCNISCGSSILSEVLEEKDETQFSDVINTYNFWLLFLFLVASWVGMAVVNSISDAICFEMLGAKGSQYGNQRLWGSIGWGLLALITGLIVDEVSKGMQKKNYTPIFYIMLVLLVCDVICMYSLKGMSPKTPNTYYKQTKLTTHILKDLGKLLRNVRVVIFLGWCIFIGFFVGIQWSFLFWYLELLSPQDNCNTSDWMKTLQGLVSGIQCFLGELPSFFASGMVLKKFGHVNIMSGILFFVGVRFLLYSFLTNPWWCLPIEILQASVGMAFATMASYASIVAPHGMEATVQGLVGAVFEGIGVSTGGLLGGFFVHNYGGATSFRIFGFMAFGASAVHIAIQYVLGRTTVVKLDGKESFNDSGQSTDSSMETIN